MRLSWNVIEGGALQDTGGRYCLLNDGLGRWKAIAEGQEIETGTLESCIGACKRDMREVARVARINRLRQEIRRLHRMEGGNWRKLKASVAKQSELERLLSAKTRRHSQQTT